MKIKVILIYRGTPQMKSEVILIADMNNTADLKQC